MILYFLTISDMSIFPTHCRLPMLIPIYAHILFKLAEETIMHASIDYTKYDQEDNI